MTPLPPVPVCLVIGRNDQIFRLLVRRLGSRATFVQSSEADCLASCRPAVDLAVIFWSGTARSSAQAVHQRYPRVKIIIEQNCSSFPGLGEKNGFVSVIERSQSQSLILEQVEKALDDWGREPEVLKAEGNIFEPDTVIGRLASIPMANGDTQRLADNLLDLFLTANKSDTGGLFLLEPGGTCFAASSHRNLPYQVNTARLEKTSKLACLLSAQSLPIELLKEPKNSLLRLFEEQFGCNLILPIRADSQLEGWLMLQVDHWLTHSDKSSLASLTFFAAETLKQSHASVLAAERIKRDLNIVTKVTEALALVKPNGEIEIIHDAQGLIVLRSGGKRAHYEKLACSSVKEAIRQAQESSREHLNFIRTDRNEMIEGNLHRLPDQGHVLHLVKANPRHLGRSNVERERALWRNLTLDCLEKFKLADGLPSHHVRAGGDLLLSIEAVFKAQSEEQQQCSHLRRLLAGLFQDAGGSQEEKKWDGYVLCPLISTAVLLVALSIRLRMGVSPTPVKMTVSDQGKQQLLVQLDMVRGEKMQSLDADSVEAVAMSGFRLSNSSFRRLSGAFGYRMEIRCPITARESDDASPDDQAQATKESCRSVVHSDTFVLHESQNTIKHIVNDRHKERTIEVPCDLGPAEDARTNCPAAG